MTGMEKLDFVLEKNKAQNLWVKMKILNPVSCDISQKLRQTKCVLFKI